MYRARVRITQIPRNSFCVQFNHRNSAQFAPFFLLSSNPVKNRNQELKFARFMYKHKNLKCVQTEVKDSVNRSNSVSVC